MNCAFCYDCKQCFTPDDLLRVLVPPLYADELPDGARAVPANICEACLSRRLAGADEDAEVEP